MVSIRFYGKDTDDWFSKGVAWGGSFKHNMHLSHCAVEWDGGIYELTATGVSYCTLEDENECRPPLVVLYLADDVEAEVKADMYPKAIALAYANMSVSVVSLLKKATGLPLNDKDVLCTDFVEIMLGNEPNHFTPLELLEAYVGLSQTVVVLDDVTWEILLNMHLVQDVEVETT